MIYYKISDKLLFIMKRTTQHSILASPLPLQPPRQSETTTVLAAAAHLAGAPLPTQLHLAGGKRNYISPAGSPYTGSQIAVYVVPLFFLRRGLLGSLLPPRQQRIPSSRVVLPLRPPLHTVSTSKVWVRPVYHPFLCFRHYFRPSVEK
jgi:hypothetical protein